MIRSPARPALLVAAASLALLTAAACTPSRPADAGGATTPSAGPVVIDSAARAEAREIFQFRCTPCHGESGAGDGPASQALTPPPRAFNSAAWQSEVSDEHIDKIIQFGGAAVGRSPTMPGNPDLTGKPAVVQALREHIRTLAPGD